MVKKTGAYRKFSKKKALKRYKSISMQYFRVKVEYNDRIVFTTAAGAGTEQAQVYGGPAMFLSRETMGGDNRFTCNLGVIMQSYTYYNTLRGLFSYYKLTGIKVEIVPESRNSALPSTIRMEEVYYNLPYPQIMFSYRGGSNNSQTLSEVKANNQSILLNSNQRVSRYWRVYGMTTSYLATEENSFFAGAFTIRNEYPIGDTANDRRVRSFMVYNQMPSFQVKINCYYIYKYSKA